jgi:hypothetical protein
VVAAYYFVSSKHPQDVLRLVEAPEIIAGERNLPHWWTVQHIREGDQIIFRDSTRKALVGLAVADRSERAAHSRAPYKRAVRWWSRDPILFKASIPDDQFRRIFAKHDDHAAGFKLFTKDNRLSRMTYAYPLNLATG